MLYCSDIFEDANMLWHLITCTTAPLKWEGQKSVRTQMEKNWNLKPLCLSCNSGPGHRLKDGERVQKQALRLLIYGKHLTQKCSCRATASLASLWERNSTSVTLSRYNHVRHPRNTNALQNGIPHLLPLQTQRRRPIYTPLRPKITPLVIY